MMPAVDIVGRGIAGLACGYRYLKAGYNVRIHGPKNLEGSASRIATGVCSMRGNRLGRDPVFLLKQYGHMQTLAWLSELINKHGFQFKFGLGLWEPFSNRKDYQKIVRRVFRGDFRGCNEAQLLKETPLPFRNFKGALHYPKDFWFEPAELLDELERFLRESGVRFFEPELRFFERASKDEVRLVFDEGALLAKEVVLAAGSCSKNILEASGFQAPTLRRVWGETLRAEGVEFHQDAGFTKFSKCGYLVNNVAKFGASSLGNEGFEEIRPQYQKNLRDSFFELFEEQTGVVVCFQEGFRLRQANRLPLTGALLLQGCSAPIKMATAYHKSGFQLADLIACFHVSQRIPEVCRSILSRQSL